VKDPSPTISHPRVRKYEQLKYRVSHGERKEISRGGRSPNAAGVCEGNRRNALCRADNSICSRPMPQSVTTLQERHVNAFARARGLQLRSESCFAFSRIIEDDPGMSKLPAIDDSRGAMSRAPRISRYHPRFDISKETGAPRDHLRSLCRSRGHIRANSRPSDRALRYRARALLL